MPSEALSRPLSNDASEPLATKRDVRACRSEVARRLLAVLMLLGGATYVLLALRTQTPLVSPDEVTYTRLGMSLADGHGLAWRGVSHGTPFALYPYAIAPAWMMASGEGAYTIVKVGGAVALCTVAIPIWWVARRMLPPMVALVPVALALAGTWMCSAGEVVTETLALPLATSGLCMVVLTILRPRRATGWAVVGLLCAATASRAQLAVLLPAGLLSLVLDCVRQPAGGRVARLRRHGAPIVALSVITALGALLLFVERGRVTGDFYAGVLGLRPGVAAILGVSGRQLGLLAAMTGVLPLGCMVAMSLRQRAWQDPFVGPLLLVLWPATFALTLQSGSFLAGMDLAWGVQRYVEYVVPLMLLLTVVVLARPGLVDGLALSIVAVVALGMAVIPAVRVIVEERALDATAQLVAKVVPGVSAGICAASVGLLLAAALAAGRMYDRRRPQGALHVARLAPLGALAAVLVAQSVLSWRWQLDFTAKLRADVPADAQWVDRHSLGPVTSLTLAELPANLDTLEAFNEHIMTVATAAWHIDGRVAGQVCLADVHRDDGSITFPRSCHRRGDEYLVADARAHAHFAGERSPQSQPRVGRLVRVAGPLRLSSLVILPCAREQRTTDLLGRRLAFDSVRPCKAFMSVDLWDRGPGTIVLSVRGGAVPHHLGIGPLVFTVPPRRVSRLRVPMLVSSAHDVFQLDWAIHRPDEPDILDVDLRHHGQTASLL